MRKMPTKVAIVMPNTTAIPMTARDAAPEAFASINFMGTVLIQPFVLSRALPDQGTIATPMHFSQVPVKISLRERFWGVSS